MFVVSAMRTSVTNIISGLPNATSGQCTTWHTSMSSDSLYIVWPITTPCPKTTDRRTSSASNKEFIAKIMFLVAVALPVSDYAHDNGFDGKIGIFPIVQEREAQRTTPN